MEFNKKIGRSVIHPIQITIANGENDISLRIRDRGGGIEKSIIHRVWEYSFTTFSEDNINASPFSSVTQFSAVQSKGGPMAGLGYGLPTARIYAEWAGGSLDLFSLDDYGCDVVLRLPKLIVDMPHKIII